MWNGWQMLFDFYETRLGVQDGECGGNDCGGTKRWDTLRVCCIIIQCFSSITTALILHIEAVFSAVG